MVSRALWRFDRIFGNSRKVGVQVVFIILFLILLIAITTLMGWLLASDYPDDGNRGILTQTIGFILNIGSLIPATSTLPLWWRILLSVLSVVVFTSFAVTFLCNFVNNRIEAYRTGTVRYWFKGHLLFLGGGAMLPAMLKKINESPTLRRRHIVVLTSDDVADVRRAVSNALTATERRLKITVLRGNIDDVEALKSVYVGKAHRIYIIGDRPDSNDYDSVSVACWNEVRRQCRGRVGVPCFLLLEHASSTRILLRQEKVPQEELDTTIVWRPEAVAQRVLVRQGSDNTYPMLDRCGIGYNDNRTVHLVLYGMTNFSQVMAVTAAHLCHFPNYVRDNSLRTRITFIAPDIQSSSAAFRSSLDSLFAQSRVSGTGMDSAPVEDFLDIEWEFVDGSLSDNEVRSKLTNYYRENQEGKTYLTLALCQNDARDNIANTLCLPEEYHRVVRKEGQVDYESTIPVLVYQPDSEELIRVAADGVPMYANLFPMGSVRESYDPSIRRHIEEAKRVNYIYSRGPSYQGMTNDQALLNRLWQTSYSNQMSSIYSAIHASVKQRSIGTTPMSDELLEVMAQVEHNRWNTEKLLAGYSPVCAEERQKLKQYDTQGDSEQRDSLEKELKQRKSQWEHYCIAPYDDLLDKVKEYDRMIVKNIQDIVTRN